MAVLEILVAPDPRLKEVAQPVEKVDDEIRQLMDDMLETMYSAKGVGLAATQLGIAKRVIVVDIAHPDHNEEPTPYKLANPEVIWASEELIDWTEGCLSVPEFYEDVTRPKKCKVKALNEKGEEVIIEAEDLLAVCLQHEIDHLNGKLFVDHISRLKRTRIIKKLEKLKKLGAVFHHRKEEPDAI